MGYMLEWDKLLSERRCRESETIGNNHLTKEDLLYDHRNEFDKDYDRIVYSSSVRRLQDKAQVFPLQENDFTRTRLTHSIEASALARSLGYAIGEWLYDKGEFKTYQEVRKLSALLQVSTLIHDLGNPPFGHYGETIIGNWFKSWFGSEEFNKIHKKYRTKSLNNQQMTDLINFEGNAQTLRIVSKLQLLNDEYGANFTYGTLATIMKYPWSSINGKTNSHKGKFGYFYSESSLVDAIHEATGLNSDIRHPATFLLEAADDMSYLLADVEDGIKKGILPWNSEYENLKKIMVAIDEDTFGYIFKKTDEKKEKSKNNKLPNDDLICYQNFKVYTQGLIFKHTVKSFKDNYEKIMNGTYDKELISDTKCNPMVEELKKLARRYCFRNSEVIKLELVGDNVIEGLLDIFVVPIITCEQEPTTKTYEGKLYSLISDNFKYMCCFDYDKHRIITFEETNLYSRLLLITDFISGMTDTFAVNLYKTLLGINLPQ